MSVSTEKPETVQIVPVIETMPADLLTPLGVYLKLSRGSSSSFLLESVEGGAALGRYSFIGADPAMTVSGDSKAVTVSDESGKQKISTPMFDFLREHFSGHHIESDTELPAFVGGAIGYLGFNCSGWFEPTLQQSSSEDEPDATLKFFRSVVAFDHANQIVNIITLAFTGGTKTESEILASAKERNAY